MEVKITLAKSALQNSAFVPSAADRMISPGPAGPTFSQESLLAGLSYQIRINQPPIMVLSDSISATPFKDIAGQSFL